MAIAPRPPIPGPMTAEYAYGDAFVAPSHLPTRMKVKADLDLFPGREVEPPRIPTMEGTPSEILQGADMPYVVPVMRGLQSHIVERRLARTQRELEAAQRTDYVVRYVGKQILENGGYTAKENPLRPATRYERRVASKLDRLIHKNRHESALAHTISMPLAISTENDLITPRSGISIKDAPVSPSFGGLWQAGKQETRFRKLAKEVHHHDHKFAKIVAKPSKKIARLVEKRDNLAAKDMALYLENHPVRKAERKQKRAEVRQAVVETAAKASQSIDRPAGRLVKDGAKKLVDGAKILKERRANKSALKSLAELPQVEGYSWTDGTYGYQIMGRTSDGTFRIARFTEDGIEVTIDVQAKDLRAAVNDVGANL